MIDLFGLGKNQDPPEEEVPPPHAVGVAAGDRGTSVEQPRGSRRLWAFLLVLDSVFVIVFAGAVAAKVYQHWEAPVAAAVLRTRRPPGRSIKEPAKTAAASAVSTETAQAPATVPITADRAVGEAMPVGQAAPRPPKPSLLSDAPKHRETPQLAAASALPRLMARSPTPAAGKVKALRVDFKLHAPKARSVDLLGAFIVRGGHLEMARQDDGAWTLTLYLKPGQYRYFFSVDKKKQLDPENPHSERGASLLNVP